MINPNPGLPELLAAAKKLKMKLVPIDSVVLAPPDPRYKCGECDTVLDEGERRCPDCNKFAARLEGFILVCPECDHPVTEEEL